MHDQVLENQAIVSEKPKSVTRRSSFVLEFERKLPTNSVISCISKSEIDNINGLMFKTTAFDNYALGVIDRIITLAFYLLSKLEKYGLYPRRKYNNVIEMGMDIKSALKLYTFIKQRELDLIRKEYMKTHNIACASYDEQGNKFDEIIMCTHNEFYGLVQPIKIKIFKNNDVSCVAFGKDSIDMYIISTNKCYDDGPD